MNKMNHEETNTMMEVLTRGNEKRRKDIGNKKSSLTAAQKSIRENTLKRKEMDIDPSLLSVAETVLEKELVEKTKGRFVVTEEFGEAIEAASLDAVIDSKKRTADNLKLEIPAMERTRFNTDAAIGGLGHGDLTTEAEVDHAIEFGYERPLKMPKFDDDDGADCSPPTQHEVSSLATSDGTHSFPVVTSKGVVPQMAAPPHGVAPQMVTPPHGVVPQMFTPAITVANPIYGNATIVPSPAGDVTDYRLELDELCDNEVEAKPSHSSRNCCICLIVLAILVLMVAGLLFWRTSPTVVNTINVNNGDKPGWFNRGG
eukprot:TRINITY_DN1101_c0_g1_i1.p1 TRINITY_DN1101_c0_g1~~TRINITY_DN1101_c0_g1_i1.p1  ORF type:complete len:329 (-),score=58.88 TRINITY_DN1101_c0_g1_i1:420-1361(-)